MTTISDAELRVRCRRHAMRRGWQRFGLAIGEPELRTLEAKITGGSATWLRDCGSRRHLWRIRWRDQELLALYDKALKTIVTFLPKGCAESRNARIR